MANLHKHRGKHASNSVVRRPDHRNNDVNRPAAHAAHASSYSRASNRYSASPSRRSKVKRLPLIIAGVVVAFILALVLGGAYYAFAINKALSFEPEEAVAIGEVTEAVAFNEPFYMLVLGSDSREGSGTSNYAPNTGDNERSDVMMLVRVDPTNSQLTIVSIPRDTPYAYDDGTIDKLNESYNRGGAAETVKAVEDVTGVDIAHFAEVRFSDLQGIVDALGGVTVNVDTPMSYKDALTGEWVEIPAGEQVLDGQQAQIFSRARHEYETDQDKHRQENVRQLASAMLQELLDKPAHEIPGTVLKLAEFVGTDLKVDDFLQLLKSFSGGGMTIYSCTGPNQGDINPYVNDMWLCYENPEGWAALMEVVDSGEDPSGVDVDSTAIIPAEHPELYLGDSQDLDDVDTSYGDASYDSAA